ncbi:MAG: twin-arginine translocase TatA/TatE family subunit [Alphaproteobacteria bacterium]
MLDFGWPELFVIIVLVVLVAGPQDLPRIMVALGRVVRRLQYARYAITQHFEDVMREADLEEIRKSVGFDEHDERGQPIAYDEAGADEAFAALGGADLNEPAHEEKDQDHA